jgi:hypothetical protein
MKIYPIIYLILSGLFYSCNNESSTTKGLFSVNPNVKNEYEKHLTFKKGEIKDTNKLPSLVKIEEYENGKLAYQNKDFGTAFPVFFTWMKDTLQIFNMIGIDNYQMINVNIYQDKAFFNYSLEGNFARFTSYKFGRISYTIKVPCETARIILSEKPQKNSKKPFYGYVEFISKEFYESSGNEHYSKDWFPQRNRFKRKTRMRIYFKSKYESL